MASDEALKPFLGTWTAVRMQDDEYNDVLQKQGVPWPMRKVLGSFTAAREVALDGSQRVMLKSKNIIGGWSEVILGEPQTFEMMGYKLETLAVWEDGMIKVTCRTTAEAGMLTAAVDITTRMTHHINEDGELVITTVAPEGQYLMWMARDEP